MKSTRLLFFACAVSICVAPFNTSGAVPHTTRATQQMEIRNSEEYDAEQFANSKPAIGEEAPDMELKTLDGETVTLSSYRGKNIVVIKAGYT